MRFQDLGKRGVLQNLSPWELIEDPSFNVRANGPDLQLHIRMLAESIRERGVLEPLTAYVQDEAVIVTNGHCRLAALKLLKLEGVEIEFVPVRLEPKGDEADRTLSLLTRNSGKPLEPLEKAQVCQRLAAYGWSGKRIASATGLSEGYVGDLFRLVEAPAEVKQMVADGKVSASMANNTVRERGHKAGTEALKGAVAAAEKKGKTKATPKDLPAPELPKAASAGSRPHPIRNKEIREAFEAYFEDYCNLHGYSSKQYCEDIFPHMEDAFLHAWVEARKDTVA